MRTCFCVANRKPRLAAPHPVFRLKGGNPELSSLKPGRETAVCRRLAGRWLSPPYLFLRVKSLIGQGLGDRACRYGVPVSAEHRAETGTDDLRPASQKRVRFESGLGAPSRAETGTVRSSRAAETGTLSPFFRRSNICRLCTRFCVDRHRNGYANRRAGRVASGFRRNGYGLSVESSPALTGRYGLPGDMHTPGVSGIMRIPRAGLALGRRVFHHSIRMNSISTAPPWGAGILLRVASPHGGRASGEPGAGRRRPAMTLHNKRRQPE